MNYFPISLMRSSRALVISSVRGSFVVVGGVVVVVGVFAGVFVVVLVGVLVGVSFVGSVMTGFACTSGVVGVGEAGISFSVFHQLHADKSSGRAERRRIFFIGGKYFSSIWAFIKIQKIIERVRYYQLKPQPP